MAEHEWFTVSEVGEEIGVPVETIRRYLRNHGVHLKVRKSHKRYQIHSDSVNVLKQIRDLYSESKNLEEVEQTLSARGVTMTVTVQTDDDEPVNVSVAEELYAIKQALQKQEEFNKALLEEFKSQKAYINESLENRDKALMESIRSLQEQRKAIAETAATKKPGFFKRLFSGK